MHDGQRVTGNSRAYSIDRVKREAPQVAEAVMQSRCRLTGAIKEHAPTKRTYTQTTGRSTHGPTLEARRAADALDAILGTCGRFVSRLRSTPPIVNRGQEADETQIEPALTGLQDDPDFRMLGAVFSNGTC